MRDEYAAEPIHAAGTSEPGGWQGRLADDGRRSCLPRVVSGEREGSNLAHTPEINHPHDWLASDPKKFERILAEVRRRGYATRDASYRPGRYIKGLYDDGAAAIAVPLLDGRRIHGSINIRWKKTAFTVEEFAARHHSH